MNEAMKKAQEFIDLVRDSGILISSASVFGSWAKGKATADSDIDVCVVSPAFGKDYIQEMVDLRKIALKVDFRIEPIPLTPKDIADPFDSLASEIRRDALLLK